jgi:hypothetical protein
MKKSEVLAVLLHVVFPVSLGLITYLDLFTLSSLLNQFLADGLWAYAFTSSLLLLWDRKPPLLWLTIALISAISFECLQYIAFFSGTGDQLDILIYLLFGSMALIINKLIRQLNLQSNFTSHDSKT